MHLAKFKSLKKTERKALLKKEEQDPTGKRKTRLGDGKQRIVLDTSTDR
jgi:hypothetical protein